MPVSPYCPRSPGHDYYGRGVYLVTLVVSGRYVDRKLPRWTEKVDRNPVKPCCK